GGIVAKEIDRLHDVAIGLAPGFATFEHHRGGELEAALVENLGSATEDGCALGSGRGIPAGVGVGRGPYSLRHMAGITTCHASQHEPSIGGSCDLVPGAGGHSDAVDEQRMRVAEP